MSTDRDGRRAEDRAPAAVELVDRKDLRFTRERRCRRRRRAGPQQSATAEAAPRATGLKHRRDLDKILIDDADAARIGHVRHARSIRDDLHPPELGSVLIGPTSRSGGSALAGAT